VEASLKDYFKKPSDRAVAIRVLQQKSTAKGVLGTGYGLCEDGVSIWADKGFRALFEVDIDNTPVVVNDDLLESSLKEDEVGSSSAKPSLGDALDDLPDDLLESKPKQAAAPDKAATKAQQQTSSAVDDAFSVSALSVSLQCSSLGSVSESGIDVDDSVSALSASLQRSSLVTGSESDVDEASVSSPSFQQGDRDAEEAQQKNEQMLAHQQELEHQRQEQLKQHEQMLANQRQLEYQRQEQLKQHEQMLANQRQLEHEQRLANQRQIEYQQQQQLQYQYQQQQQFQCQRAPAPRAATRFYKGGQFMPGGRRAPKGGTWA
jgi:hypothetical protein